VTILVGKGNNGGDGLVAARHLANWGARVLVCLVDRQMQGSAAINLQIAQRLGIDLLQVQANGNRKMEALLTTSDLVVDALLGTGTTGPPRGLVAELIESLSLRRGPILSVDLPSGTNSLGQVFQPRVQATATITFGTPKLGHVVYPAGRYTGKVYLADLGLPSRLIQELCQEAELLDSGIYSKLPARDPQTHKGKAGKVLLVAGSIGYSGAAGLLAQGALRAGAGLVTLAVPQSIYPILASKLTEAMVWGLPEENGILGPSSLPRLLELAEGMDAIAIGPGLGRGEGPGRLVEGLLVGCDQPVVVDADGLFALSQLSQRPKRSGPLILTPHSGEMARLLKLTCRQVDSNRLALAKRAAKLWQATVVLKGPRTVIADSQSIPYLNPTGNAAMASGGMGDLLSGIIAGLLPQVESPLAAAALGSYVHGLCGDLAADKLSAQRGLVASDLLQFIPGALAGKYKAEGIIHLLEDHWKEGEQ
jgi:hydroxyethylthiazole kinase-like uncharacterized protein yjeF